MPETPIVCNMDALGPDERAQHEQVTAAWQSAIQETVEQPNGYAFRFEADRDLLMCLAEFVSRERLCCPFLRFELVLESDGTALWLRLLGAAEVKAFIQTKLP
ncbi:MAG: hypothetical protein GYB68_14000 [Chloroflexi bacterium]|nr:hypothetical protein [Chloroflexota bacterium]